MNGSTPACTPAPSLTTSVKGARQWLRATITILISSGNLVDLWREDPTKPIGAFGLRIVLIDGRPHWEGGEALSEYDLRFVAEEDFAAPAGPRTSREYLLEMALWKVGPVLRHVRMKCSECMGGERGSLPRGGVAQAVLDCGAVACPLWPFRLGFDPRREEMPEERRAALRERARQHGFGSGSPGTIAGERAQERREGVNPMDYPSADPNAFLERFAA